MNGLRINDLKLRVCFYARVSTDKDVQINSLNNQLEYYKNYIKSNPNWTYIDGYIDEGLSGVRVEKRESFKRMIRDAKNGKFDLIITKEVSRFARDLEDSIHYIRLLKDANVGIFFENQNLNTFDSNSELVLNIMFNLAQDESKKLSSRIKFGHRQAIENGHVLGSSNIKGYNKNNCKLVVDEKEATFIKKLFELYSTGKYGFYRLSKKLGSLGYLNIKGNLYDKASLKRMITNPKYKGYYRGKTTEIIDYRTKKKRKTMDFEQIIYKCNNDAVPAIVSEEIWDKANEILVSRTKKYNNSNNFTGGLKYAFSSKVYCKEHNVTYQRSYGSKNKNRPVWTCSKYLKYGFNTCSSPIIPEIDLYNIMKKIMNKVISQKGIIVSDILELYDSLNKNNQYSQELKHIEKEILNIENKKKVAIDLITDGDISKEELKKQFIYYKNELNLLIKNKKRILNQLEISKKNKNNLSNLSNFIEKEINGEAVDEFVRIFIHKIIVTKINNDRNNINLDIYLNIYDDCKEKNEDGSIIYLENEKIDTLEQKIKNKKCNKYIYNIYIET